MTRPGKLHRKGSEAVPIIADYELTTSGQVQFPARG